MERNRITPAIIIDLQSGGCWGVSHHPKSVTFDLADNSNYNRYEKSLDGGSKLVGKRGQFSTGIFKVDTIWGMMEFLFLKHRNI